MTTVFIFAGCTHLSIKSSKNVANISETGLIECFPAAVSKEKKKLSCEASATAYHDGGLYVVSDKQMATPRSAFMKLDNHDRMNRIKSYLRGPVFENVKKIEAMAVDHSSGLIFASTGFDRVKESNHSWDSYNLLMAFDSKNELDVKVVNEELNEGYISSMSIRDALERAIAETYFKIEGLAHLPNKRLVFGVREKGSSYKNFESVIEAYIVSYSYQDGKILISDEIKPFFKIDSKKIGVEQSVALSSLEYNSYDNSLYMLTSYETSETAEGLGGYLWKIRLDNISDLKAVAEPVFDLNGNVLHFKHKPEGLTILPSNRIFVVFDDDRVVGNKIITDNKNQFFRPINSFAYVILEMT